MENIRTLIIDDEALVRVNLRDQLSRYDEIKVLGEAENAEEAMELIARYKPNLIFLDIKMPQKSGIDVLDWLNREKIPCGIIFLTAHPEYAMEVINNQADIEGYKRFIKYILKPNQEFLLKDCLRHFLDERFVTFEQIIDHRRATQIIHFQDIIYCEGCGAYSDIHLTNGEKIVVCKSIGELEEMLPEFYFFRTGRSHIIQFNKVTQITARDGTYAAVVDGVAHHIQIGVKEAKNLKEEVENRKFRKRG